MLTLYYNNFFRKEMRRKNKLHRMDPTTNAEQIIFRNHRFLTTLVTQPHK